MMTEQYFIGFDTSNYTTSVALADGEGNVLLNKKIPLPVQDGERGLRQSDAVFHHTKNLPEAVNALSECLNSIDRTKIVAIGVSRSPRDAEGSYMPCFLAGVSVAQTAGAVLGVPVFPFSHQAGHIMAAVHSAKAEEVAKSDFLAFHVSGGTTDVLTVSPSEEYGFAIEKIGGTKDINAGQAIDRAGVYMGLHFPCGAEMEKLAQTFTGKIPAMHLSVDGTWCNLSGIENKAQQLYNASADRAEVSAFVLHTVAQNLCALRDTLREKYGSRPIVYAGGVMSCRKIQTALADRNAYFAEPQFSADNATGIALLARWRCGKGAV